MGIHTTAIIEEGAEVSKDVEIGAYSYIGANVKISSGCRVHNHVVIDGHTSIGKNNEFFHFCSIGAPPQDKTYKGEPTEVIIGDNNTFREYVSIHRGTTKDHLITKIGSDNLFMAYVHLGHDVQFANNCVIANSVNLAGHVKIGDKVTIGGGTLISQFVSVGQGAYIGGATAVDRDVPQYCTAYGNRVRLKGINIIGMRRQGYDKHVVTETVDFYRTMEASALSPKAFVDHDELMQDFRGNEIIEEIAAFIQKSEVGIAPFIT